MKQKSNELGLKNGNGNAKTMSCGSSSSAAAAASRCVSADLTNKLMDCP
jgi:mevalonate pyrophosphate decarboxylase